MSLLDQNSTPPNAQKRIAIVLANPAQSTTTGWPVGFWWSELTHPYAAFVEAGYAVEIFSPSGGVCTADSMSNPNDQSGYAKTDLLSQGFIHTPELVALLQTTRPVGEIEVAAFDAILIAGGQAPMFSYATAVELQQKFVEFYSAGKITAALCHGVAILKFAKLANGELLAKGKTVTGFANVEEDFADAAVWRLGILPQGKSLMPWRIEDAMKALGANYVQAGLWRAFAIRDGNLITGQQNYSGAKTAELIIAALGQ